MGREVIVVSSQGIPDAAFFEAKNADAYCQFNFKKTLAQIEQDMEENACPDAEIYTVEVRDDNI